MGYCVFALSSDLINISDTAPSAIYLHEYSPEFKWNWLKILFIPRGWILVILISLDLSFCATIGTKFPFVNKKQVLVRPPEKLHHQNDVCSVPALCIMSYCLISTSEKKCVYGDSCELCVGACEKLGNIHLPSF